MISFAKICPSTSENTVELPQMYLSRNGISCNFCPPNDPWKQKRMTTSDRWASKTVTKRIIGRRFFLLGSGENQLHFSLGKKTFHDVIGKLCWHSKYNSADRICSVPSVNILVAFMLGLGTVTHELLNEHCNCKVHGLYTGHKDKTIAFFQKFQVFFGGVFYVLDFLGFFSSKCCILRLFYFFQKHYHFNSLGANPGGAPTAPCSPFLPSSYAATARNREDLGGQHTMVFAIFLYNSVLNVWPPPYQVYCIGVKRGQKPFKSHLDLHKSA